MMPLMDEVELCKEIRLARFGRYTYFISQPSKPTKWIWSEG